MAAATLDFFLLMVLGDWDEIEFRALKNGADVLDGMRAWKEGSGIHCFDTMLSNRDGKEKKEDEDFRGRRN